MKLNNFTSLDPAEAARGIKGLSGASQLDREVWQAFAKDPASIVEEMEAVAETAALISPEKTGYEILLSRGSKYEKPT